MSKKKRKMTRTSCKIRYTTKAAFNFAIKRLNDVSCKKEKDKILKSMDGNKIKVVIKIYEYDEDLK